MDSLIFCISVSKLKLKPHSFTPLGTGYMLALRAKMYLASSGVNESGLKDGLSIDTFFFTSVLDFVIGTHV